MVFPEQDIFWCVIIHFLVWNRTELFLWMKQVCIIQVMAFNFKIQLPHRHSSSQFEVDLK
jgi:hypothetical protein